MSSLWYRIPRFRVANGTRCGMKWLPALSAALGLLVSVSGCGSGYPTTSTVSGKVTFGGQPVTEGMIVFQPKHGRPALGTIRPDGSYVLTTFREGDGALPGEHLVTIQSRRVRGGMSAARNIEEELTMSGRSSAPTTVQWLVPERYSREATTPLKANVNPDQNIIDFDLQP